MGTSSTQYCYFIHKIFIRKSTNMVVLSQAINNKNKDALFINTCGYRTFLSTFPPEGKNFLFLRIYQALVLG